MISMQKIRAIVEGYLLQLFWLSVADWFSGWAYGISRFATPTDFETVNTICVIQTVSIGMFNLTLLKEIVSVLCLTADYSLDFAAYFPLVALFW